MSNHNSNYPPAAPSRVEPEVITSTVSAIEELCKLPALHHADIEAIKERIEYFFKRCAEIGMRPTIEGMALALGVDRKTVYRWSSEEGSRGEVIRKAKQRIAVMLEQWFITGKINPAAGIFLLKNHFGYRDNYDINQEIGNQDPLSALPTKEEILRHLPIDSDE